MTLSKDSSELARQFIDASLKKTNGHAPKKAPSKAAYARAVRMARQAIEELTVVARRMGDSRP